MKKLLITFITILSLSLPGFAITPMANLTIIENNLFGYENTSINTNQRLEKIETTIYGNIQKNTIENRLKKINTDLGINLSNYALAKKEAVNLKNDPSANYPIINEMEQRLFKKTFTNENIYKRLDRLEIQTFGKTIKNPLNARVDNLAQKINIKNTSDYQNIVEKPDYNYFVQEELTQEQPNVQNDQIPTIQRPMPASPNFNLNTLEKNVLGTTFPQENADIRLSRLEKKLLHKNFSAEDDKTRLERLSAVQDATKTPKMYDSNKWSKTINTGMQIGGILLMILTMII